MSFDAPQVWPLLALVPLLGWLLHRSTTRRAARIRELLGPGAGRLGPAPSLRAHRRRDGMLTASILLLVLACMGPRWGTDLSSVEQRGVDIVLALDVSRSMWAEDQAPSRLGAAREQIVALGQKAGGDRLALVLFAGTARLRVPLTRDHASLAELAAAADPYSVREGGSDLGQALDAALAALPARGSGHECIVLLTDGEDHDRKGQEAAARCAERGVVVHCVGFGTGRGGKIPVPGGGFVKGPAGEDVVTTLDEPSLRALAERGSGRFVRADERDDALVQLYERQILGMARKNFEAEVEESRLPRFHWPLLFVFILWILDLCRFERRSRS